MAPREDGQLFSEGMCPGINHTQKHSLLPGMNAGWRDLGGLALTLALKNAAICMERRVQMFLRGLLPSTQLLLKGPSQTDLVGSDMPCLSAAQRDQDKGNPFFDI